MPDDQMTLGAQATLTAGVSSSAPTLPLSAAIGVADGRTMRVVCEGEVLLVTAGMGTTSLTVTRGQEGTTAAAHPSGATVQQRLTPAGLANTRTQPNPHAHNGTDGSGTVAHSATTGRTANDHHNQAHSLTGTDHTLSGLTTGHVLTATGPTAAAFQAPTGGGAPAAHATTHQPGGTDALAVDAAASTGSLRTLGTSGTSAAAGNDGRLSDARTPTTHASSHVGGGSDAIAAFVASGAGHKSGLVPDPGVTGGTTKYLREDSSWQVPPGGGGGTLTVEEVDGTPSVAATKLILPNGTVSVSGTEATYTPAGGGGGAVVQLGEVVVGAGGAASIAFSSISSSYRNLRLVLSVRGDTAALTTGVSLRFNGDTGANYDGQVGSLYGGGSLNTFDTIAGTSMPVGLAAAGTAPANTFSPLEILLHDYANTTTHKGVRSHAGYKQANSTNSTVTSMGTGTWRSTSAINAITLLPTAGNFAQYTVATLYGEQ
jgi:hypothetical protein